MSEQTPTTASDQLPNRPHDANRTHDGSVPADGNGAPGDSAAAASSAPQDMPGLIRVSEALRKFVDAVGRFGSWLILPLVFITVFDVTARKLIWIQIWLVENFGRTFDSTVLQELEWHFHTGLFTLVLAYGYIWNSHVRVDLVRETLSFKKKAWLEFLGLVFFLIPYILIVIYFSFIYAYDSWAVGEISASTVGLSHRWIIKSVLVFGLITVALAGLSVLFQVIIVLFGPANVTRFRLMTLEWPDEVGTRVEGKERLDLRKVEDELERRSRQQREQHAPASGGAD